MPSYRVGGLVLTTDLELPELAATPPADDGWTVVQEPTAGAPVAPHLGDLVDAHGRVWATLAGGAGPYRISFPGLAAFTIEVPERLVRVVVERGVAEPTVRHLLLDQVIPHLLAIDGSLVLHASAVSLEQGAVLLVGPSGAGKSSLAAAFVHSGAGLLADDFVLLRERAERYDAVPAYAGLRLWPDSADALAGADGVGDVAHYTTKARWAPRGTMPSADEPVAAIVLLGDPDPQGPSCALGPVGGRDAFIELYQQAFRMERGGRERHAAELERFARLATTVPVLLLEHQRRFELLPTVVAAVRAAVRDVGHPA